MERPTLRSHEDNNGLVHIDHVRPLDATDISCLDEIKEALLEHGKVERFGVHLLHKHFDLESNEVMVEDSRVAAKEIVGLVKNYDEKRYVASAWALECSSSEK